MAQTMKRFLTLAALLAAGGLEAQDEGYKAKYQINYKRFTRGDDVKVVDEAWGRLEWFRERMGGDLGSDFAQHLLREAEKERTKYPSLFRTPGGPELPGALNGPPRGRPRPPPPPPPPQPPPPAPRPGAPSPRWTAAACG